MLLLRREARQASKLPRIACKCPDNWLPCGCGHWKRGFCLVCGSGEPGQPYAASLMGSRAQATLAARCFWASLWLKGISFRRGARWLLSTPSPALASLLVPKSRVPGLCQHRALLHCPSGMGHGGLERTSGLPQPPQPGHLWSPWNAVAWRRAGTRERPCSAALAKWLGIPGMAYLALSLPLRLTEGNPQGPCQGSFCQVVSAQAEGGRDIGHN